MSFHKDMTAFDIDVEHGVEVLYKTEENRAFMLVRTDQSCAGLLFQVVIYFGMFKNRTVSQSVAKI